MHNFKNVRVMISCSNLESKAQSFADNYQLPVIFEKPKGFDGFVLDFNVNGIRLVSSAGHNLYMQVDFASGGAAHRRKFGGGQGQAIAKAIGLNKTKNIRVLDATAGLGQDAFVLATLGCQVTMLERSPIAHVLLCDGMARAGIIGGESDAELTEILARMHLLEIDSLAYLQDHLTPRVSVVYLDPMFPPRNKSAAVKKEMAMFHELIGADHDADALLEPALAKAIHRVVVKRPKIAPYLNDKEPSYQLIGKSSRFDIYTIKAY